MIFNNINEAVKSQLECNIGCFVLEELFNAPEYDILDAYSVITNFIPSNYVICRENYLYK